MRQNRTLCFSCVVSFVVLSSLLLLLLLLLLLICPTSAFTLRAPLSRFRRFDKANLRTVMSVRNGSVDYLDMQVRTASSASKASLAC
jgi:hypothetical protein